jgi:two-component system sensor histidine kinase DegS
VPAAQTSQALATELTRLGHLLRGETARLRDMMQGLTPRELPPGQLMGTIAEVVQRFQLDTGITARFITPVDRLALSPRGCRELTRIVQEALVNVRKHSGARNVVVRLTPAAGVCQLSIDDDGQGFPYAGRRSLDLEQAHLSLWSIRERVRVLGGQITVESNPGRGARVEITFPVASHATH